MYSFNMQVVFGGHPLTNFTGVVSKKEVSYTEQGDLDVKFTVSTQVSEYDPGTKKNVTRTAFYNFHETGKEEFASGSKTPLALIAQYVEDNEIVQLWIQIDTVEGEPRTWIDKENYAHGSWNGKVVMLQTLSPKWMKDMIKDHAENYREAARGNAGRRQVAGPRPTNTPVPANISTSANRAPAPEESQENGEVWR